MITVLHRGGKAVPLTVLVGFLVWFPMAVADNRFWLVLGLQALWTAMVVIGVNLLLGYTGLLSLGQAAFFVLGGFVGAIWAVEDWGLDPWLGFPAALVFGMLLGAGLALTCCHLRGFYLTVVTLAFGLLASSFALLVENPFNGQSGRAVAEPLETDFGFIDATNPNRPFIGLFVVGSVLLLFCLAVSWNVVHSRWGRAYQAIRESEVAAKACGVATYRHKVSVFALSAGMASLAGTLAAQTNLQVTMAGGTAIVGQSFEQVIYASFGGLGTIAGPIVGAFTFTLGFGLDLGGRSLQERLGAGETLFLGALVILITVALPRGVVGTAQELLRPRRARRRTPSPAPPPPELRPRHDRPAGSTLLEVRNLSIAFGGLDALEGIDLDVVVGSVHALIGPNGSGKSTFANVVTGLYRPDRGRLVFGGRDITDAAPQHSARLGLARTFQTCQIWRRMTVLSNVLVGAHSRSRTGLARSALLPPSLRPDERAQQVAARALLAFVGLADRAQDPAGSLPFIDQRRLEIARALASRPELLILDEPAAGMYPADVAELENLIRQVRDAGVTVLLIEHRMEVVMNLCDRVTVLDFGRKIAEGTSEEVVHDPTVVEAYLGAAAPAARTVTATPPREDRDQLAPVLSVRDLEVDYGAASALRGVHLEVGAGETVALIGANGAGKTTTLKAISGVAELLMSASGEVTFQGERIDGLPAHQIARRGLAHVPEGRRLFPESTVEENLLLGAHRRRDPEVSADLAAAFERFPVLGRLRHRPAGLLSGGEQQMLAIARALMARPDFLLLDEPSVGLAPMVVDQLFATIRELADEGLPILLVEQLASKALEACDRAYILETGTVVRSGRGADLARDPEVRAAYLGD